MKRPQKTELAKVPLGALTQERVEAYVSEWLPEEKIFPGVETQGILGNLFLSRSIAQIDYPRSVVRFCDLKSGWSPAGPGIRFQGDLIVDNAALSVRGVA